MNENRLQSGEEIKSGLENKWNEEKILEVSATRKGFCSLLN